MFADEDDDDEEEECSQMWGGFSQTSSCTKRSPKAAHLTKTKDTLLRREIEERCVGRERARSCRIGRSTRLIHQVVLQDSECRLGLVPRLKWDWNMFGSILLLSELQTRMLTYKSSHWSKNQHRKTTSIITTIMIIIIIKNIIITLIKQAAMKMLLSL